MERDGRGSDPLPTSPLPNVAGADLTSMPRPPFFHLPGRKHGQPRVPVDNDALSTLHGGETPSTPVSGPWGESDSSTPTAWPCAYPRGERARELTPVGGRQSIHPSFPSESKGRFLPTGKARPPRTPVTGAETTEPRTTATHDNDVTGAETTEPRAPSPSSNEAAVTGADQEGTARHRHHAHT